MNKKTLVWLLRILVFALFVLSAVAKMFPIWAFEKQLVDLGLMSWCMAPYFSRALIALELAIGILIIQPHFLKKIVIPVTIGLLVVFCAHLTLEMVKHGAMNGNCGCFGQLIPMTPLEAFIKNIVTIILLVIVYRNVETQPSSKDRFSVLLIVWLMSTLLLYVAFPFCPCGKTPAPDTTFTSVVEEEEEDSTEVQSTSTPIDTAMVKAVAPSAIVDTAKKDSVVAKPKEPTPVKSKYSAHNVFSGKKVNLDKGKKIVCFFAAGCDHCQNTAKSLMKLSKTPGFPKVYIYFMDEETFKIPEFFQYAQGEFPYTILDIPLFWTMLNDGSTPGVYYMWNGNVMKSWVGIEDKAYNEAELQTEVKKEFK
jgi:thiol-disulfide isomerase/thioredoxin